MSWRSVPLVKGAALVAAALLLTAPQVLAGQPFHAAHAPPASSQAAPAPVVRFVPVPVTVSVVVTEPARAATEQLRVDLRGPDGELRSFSLEGGLGAIQSQPVLVLRPGESVTIRVAAKR